MAEVLRPRSRVYNFGTKSIYYRYLLDPTYLLQVNIIYCAVMPHLQHI